MEGRKVVATERGAFEVLVAGPSDGPAVLLLHGFPQLNVIWEPYLGELAAAGYRTIAPNQRGYGASVRDGSYVTRDLVADLVALLDALGVERAVVVGHDWGGAVAWGLAARYPQRVAGLVALNCPPPSVLRERMRTSPRQLARSWYMLAFQLPWLPERLVAGRVPGMIRAGSAVRGVWSAERLEPYARAFAAPADVAGPINWYRGALRRGGSGGPRSQPISAPVLVIWGVRDPFLGRDLVSVDALRHVLAEGNSAEIVEVADAGHFVVDEAVGTVTATLLSWLARTASTGSAPA